ncbi:tetratricopeptide repeat protein [Roseivirga sp. BDSF3-8]|uniref:ATP-binding protein n=1 Tax=Roseivirga sp. BDSF3-8 TaxID=3241598 RepID=UPI0035322536
MKKELNKYIKVLFLATLAIFLSSQAYSFSSQVDSLLNTIPAANPNQQVEILLQTAKKRLTTNPMQSLQFAKKAKEISEEEGNKMGLSRSIRYMGGAKFYMGDYFEAASLYSEAREIAREEGLLAEETAAINNLGLLLSETGSYDLALNYLFQALSLTPEDDLETRSVTLNNIGQLYEKIKDHTRAMEYMRRSLELKKQINDPDMLAFSYNHLGNYFLNSRQLDSARYYFVLGSGSSIKGNNQHQRAVSLQGFGDVYLLERKYEQATEEYMEALEIQKRINDRAGLSLTYHSIAESFLDQGKIEKAKVYLDSSFAISDKIRNQQQALYNLILLAEIYEKQGNLEKTIQLQKKVLSLKDSLFNDEIARNVRSTQVRFDVEQTRRELEGKELELALNRRMLLYLGLFSVLLLALVFLLMHGFRIQKKQNAKIAEQHDLIVTKTKELSSRNQELESARKIIQNQNSELLALNEGLEKQVIDRTAALHETNQELTHAVMELDNFIYKTSHDIRGPLARLKGLTNLALLDVKDDKSREYFQMLDSTAESMDNILKRLLTINMIKNIAPKNELVRLRELINEIVTQVKDLHPFNFIEVLNEVGQGLEIRTDPNLIRLILFNLLENAIKFHDDREGAYVKISVMSDPRRFLILVEDNGTGISEQYGAKVFDMFVSASKSSGDAGLGLFLTKLSAERLNGHVTLDNNPNYTRFTVELPNRVEHY